MFDLYYSQCLNLYYSPGLPEGPHAGGAGGRVAAGAPGANKPIANINHTPNVLVVGFD